MGQSVFPLTSKWMLQLTCSILLRVSSRDVDKTHPPKDHPLLLKSWKSELYTHSGYPVWYHEWCWKRFPTYPRTATSHCVAHCRRCGKGRSQLHLCWQKVLNPWIPYPFPFPCLWELFRPGQWSPRSHSSPQCESLCRIATWSFSLDQLGWLSSHESRLGTDLDSWARSRNLSLADPPQLLVLLFHRLPLAISDALGLNYMKTIYSLPLSNMSKEKEKLHYYFAAWHV